MGDRDSGHRTGKPRQAGGKGVRIEEIVGRCSAGGRDPQRLMAGPRRPSDGTLGGWPRLSLTLYGSPILTESNG